MKLKNGLLIACLVLIGTTFAQETPPEPPVREVTPPPPAPPVRERMAVPPPPPPPGPAVPVGENEVVDFPDVEAQFPGGTKAMKKYIQENVQYPEISRELGDQGRVYVTFIVELDGSVSSVEVMRGGVTPELNREAKRLIRSMPKWKPGEMASGPVRCRCRLPITFILTDPKKGDKK